MTTYSQTEVTQKEKVFTIPNLLSMVRILMIPLIVWLYCTKEAYGWTVVTLLLSGATDIVDGWIARKYDMTSDLGKVLDPVADKLTQGITLLILITRFPLMLLPFLLLIAKEAIMAITGLMVIKKTGNVLGALWHGKVTTFLLYATMMIHVFFYDIAPLWSNALIILCVSFMVLSFVLYLIRNFNAINAAPSLKES